MDLVISSGNAVPISYDIPDDANKLFNITVFYEGKQIYETGNLDPTTMDSKTSSLSISQAMGNFDSGKYTVFIKYNGYDYGKYTIDFSSGTATAEEHSTLPREAYYAEENDNNTQDGQ